MRRAACARASLYLLLASTALGCGKYRGVESTVDKSALEQASGTLLVKADPGSCAPDISAWEMVTAARYAAAGRGWRVIIHKSPKRLGPALPKPRTLHVRCNAEKHKITLEERVSAGRFGVLYTDQVPYYELSARIDGPDDEAHLDARFGGEGRYAFTSDRKLYIAPRVELVMRGLAEMLYELPQRPVPPLTARRPENSLSVIVAVDEDFRREFGSSWDERARTAVFQGSKYLEHHFALGLTVDRVVEWNQGESAGGYLGLQLDHLSKEITPKPGQIVIGLTFERTQDYPNSALGVARPAGQHAVINIEPATDPRRLGGSDRIGFVVAHEIGHLLGAPHVGWQDALMFPSAGELAPVPDPVLTEMVALATTTKPGETPSRAEVERFAKAYANHGIDDDRVALALYALRAGAHDIAVQVVETEVRREPWSAWTWRLAARAYLAADKNTVTPRVKRCRQNAAAVAEASKTCFRQCVTENHEGRSRAELATLCETTCQKAAARVITPLSRPPAAEK